MGRRSSGNGPRPEQPHRKRAAELEAEQPGLVELKKRLLALGGDRVVWVGPEPHLDELLASGRLFSSEGLSQRFIEDHRAHGNAATLWYESNGHIRIATGYARNGGMWVPHSWGVEGGGIVETTSTIREAYLGVELASVEALRFVFANLPDGQKRILSDLAKGRCPTTVSAIAQEVMESLRP